MKNNILIKYNQVIRIDRAACEIGMTYLDHLKSRCYQFLMIYCLIYLSLIFKYKIVLYCKKYHYKITFLKKR